MEHDELLAPLFGQHAIYDREQVGVEMFFCVGGGGLFDEAPLVGLPAEEIDKRMVGLLVGKEHGVEPGLFEGGNEAFLAVDVVVVFGRDSGEQHGHAFVGGVRLCEGFVENKQSALRREPGGGIARVGVEAEVCRAGGLPYHEHIQLALVRVVGWMSFKGEIARGFRISGCGSGSLYGQFYVVEYIQGYHLLPKVPYR